MSTLERNLWIGCIACLILVGAFAAGHHLGYASGSKHVLAEWTETRIAEQQAAAKAQQELQNRLEQQAAQHRKEQEQIAHDLEQVRQDYAASLLAQRSEFEQRLLQSTHRSQVYRDQAASGAAAARDLASHAARLDRALEEGRELVQELAGTLRLRDQQLKLLSEQIRIDRQLMSGEMEH